MQYRHCYCKVRLFFVKKAQATLQVWSRLQCVITFALNNKRNYINISLHCFLGKVLHECSFSCYSVSLLPPWKLHSPPWHTSDRQTRPSGEGLWRCWGQRKLWGRIFSHICWSRSGTDGSPGMIYPAQCQHIWSKKWLEFLIRNCETATSEP